AGLHPRARHREPVGPGGRAPARRPRRRHLSGRPPRHQRRVEKGPAMLRSPAGGRWSVSRLTAVLVAMSVIGAGCAGNTIHLRDKEAASPARVSAAAPGAAAPAAPAGGAAASAAGESAAPAADQAGTAAVTATAPGAATGSPGPAAAGTSEPKRASAAAAPGTAAAPTGAPAAGGAPGAPAASGRSAGPAGATPGGPGPASPGTPAPAPPPAASGPGTTTGVGRDSVNIGLFYAKTGFYAGLLRNAPAVMQAAFDEAGPINGRRLVLKTYDDGSYNPSTIQVEEKRAKDESFGFVSLVSESDTILAPLVEQHRVPTIVGNIDQHVALPLHHVFPLLAYWARQATILPEFIKNALGAGDRKIGIVYEGTSTAKDAKEQFK